jgi:hypothetical protein
LLALLAAALLGLAWLDAGVAQANGKATLISSQEQGPYRFEVSILPSRAIVNNTHLSLRVIALESEETLTEAAVNVSAEGPEMANRFGPLVADNDVLPQFFETTLPFSAPGPWQVTINVITELGDETIRVPLEVRAGQPINLILVAAIAVAFVAVSIWTYDRIKAGIRRRRASA